MRTYFRLLAFSRPYSSFLPSYLVLVLFSIVFGVINFTLLIPLLNILFGTLETPAVTSPPEFAFSAGYLRDLFNYNFGKAIAAYGKKGALTYVCMVILACVFLANVFRFFSQKVLSSMRTRVVRNIRAALFNKIVSVPVGFFSDLRKGDILSTVSGDVHEIENSVVSSVQVVFREPILIIAYFILLFSISVKLTLFTILFLPVAGAIITTISKALRKQASEGQTLLGSILSITEEAVSGVRIIKGFNAAGYVTQKFSEQNNWYARIARSIINKRELASPVSEFLGVSVVIVILLYGGTLVIDGTSDISASEFITYIVLYSQILPPAKNISNAVTNIQRGLAAGDRVLKILDQPEEPHSKALPDVKGLSDSIRFSKVSFRYKEKWVLREVDLEIKKGEIVALVGQSGSGKSTLADLIPRFYDPQEGAVLLDGKDIREYSLDSLRSIIGIVTQEAILFNDSVFNNIAFGSSHATMEQVVEAAKIANAHEFIINMEGGYHSNIGDRGGKLSGGQRQRLSIARAVLKNPPLLILDEATSALDTESEKVVQDALYRLMKNRTTLVIAHRLSTIHNADKIVVLQEGRIVETGTHGNLVGRDGVYRKLYELQSFK